MTDDTPISASDQPSSLYDTTTTKETTLTYLDDDGDVVPDSLLSPRQKRQLDIDRDYADARGVPLEDVESETASKRSRIEWYALFWTVNCYGEVADVPDLIVVLAFRIISLSLPPCHVSS